VHNSVGRRDARSCPSDVKCVPAIIHAKRLGATALDKVALLPASRPFNAGNKALYLACSFRAKGRRPTTREPRPGLSLTLLKAVPGADRQKVQCLASS
jgi:hypothetical protein